MSLRNVWVLSALLSTVAAAGGIPENAWKVEADLLSKSASRRAVGIKAFDRYDATAKDGVVTEMLQNHTGELQILPPEILERIAQQARAAIAHLSAQEPAARVQAIDNLPLNTLACLAMLEEKSPALVAAQVSQYSGPSLTEIIDQLHPLRYDPDRHVRASWRNALTQLTSYPCKALISKLQSLQDDPQTASKEVEDALKAAKKRAWELR